MDRAEPAFRLGVLCARKKGLSLARAGAFSLTSKASSNTLRANPTARNHVPPPCTWVPRGGLRTEVSSGEPGGRGVNARQRVAPAGALGVVAPPRDRDGARG